MNEDLKWLAENVHKWPCENYQTIRRNGENDFAVYTSGFVTRAQWQAARDELTAQKEWRGPEDGLPPVGAEVEVWVENVGYWAAVTVLAVDIDTVIFRNGSDRRSYVGIHMDNVRPICTEEDKAVKEIVAVWKRENPMLGDTMQEVYARQLYRAGYRKQENPK